MKRGLKCGIATIAFTVIAAASASPAAAAPVTIGQLPPTTPPTNCFQQLDALQPAVTSGNTYVVPATGTVTSWSHYAGAGAGQFLSMKVFRKVADPATYAVVGHDGARSLTGGVINTFPASIAVKPGDVLGVNSANAETVNNACAFAAPGETGPLLPGDLADGATAAFVATSTDSLLNVTAIVEPSNTVVEPSNSFSLGKVKRNKKKGTATLAVEVPNPGTLVLGGKGVKDASAAGAVISKTVDAAGTVKLLIKAKGKKKKKLKKKGKVKLNPTITYTPTGGAASAQTKKLTLKKKLKPKKQ